MDTGCWVDSHWGQYGIARMVEIAADHGYADAEIIGFARAHLLECAHPGTEHLSDEDAETLQDAADEIEAWLNDHVAEAEHAFGWHDGEFYYWPMETWRETE
jgi:hypothetical protein